MGSSIKEVILKTLLYSDIFNYPLTKDEVWSFLISEKKLEKEKVFNFLNSKTSVLVNKNNYFVIKGREELIGKRKERENYSVKKINLAKKIIKKLSKIPTVDFIGISGALAMKNSDKHDDIDLFVIAAKKTVWITRLIMIIYLKILNVYRTKNDKNPSDKVCLNMLIDETVLSFSKKRRDLYSAHEIFQIMPIFSRNKTYEKFILSNQWTEAFLPNVFEEKKNAQFVSDDLSSKSLIKFLINSLGLEYLARNIQFAYMKKNITKETVSRNFLAFHPYDYKKFVMKEYKKRLMKFDIVINTRGY